MREAWELKRKGFPKEAASGLGVERRVEVTEKRRCVSSPDTGFSLETCAGQRASETGPCSSMPASPTHACQREHLCPVLEPGGLPSSCVCPAGVDGVSESVQLQARPRAHLLGRLQGLVCTVEFVPRKTAETMFLVVLAVTVFCGLGFISLSLAPFLFILLHPPV